MGAGDVKLLAGVAPWVWATTTFYAFCVSGIVGGVIAVGMVLYRRNWRHHYEQLGIIVTEILVLRNPEQLAAIAAERRVDVAVALWDSHRYWDNCLFCLDRHAHVGQCSHPYLLIFPNFRTHPRVTANHRRTEANVENPSHMCRRNRQGAVCGECA